MEVIYKTEPTLKALETALFALQSYNESLKLDIEKNPELTGNSRLICLAGVQTNEEAIVLIERMLK